MKRKELMPPGAFYPVVIRATLTRDRPKSRYLALALHVFRVTCDKCGWASE